MKAIVAGDDPGNLGVKEIDQQSTSSSGLDVSALCNPHSSETAEQTTLASTCCYCCSSAAVVQCRILSRTS